MPIPPEISAAIGQVKSVFPDAEVIKVDVYPDASQWGEPHRRFALETFERKSGRKIDWPDSVLDRVETGTFEAFMEEVIRWGKTQTKNIKGSSRPKKPRKTV